MDNITLLGLLAGSITTFSYLPQVIKILKTKSAHDVSIEMAALLCVGAVLWTIYGVWVRALPIILANSISFCFVFAILILRIKYR